MARDQLPPKEKMMPFDSNKAVEGRFIDPRELTLDQLDAVSGGKPAKSPPPKEYLKFELKQVLVSSYD
jgi:hypothetical protein